MTPLEADVTNNNLHTKQQQKENSIMFIFCFPLTFPPNFQRRLFLLSRLKLGHPVGELAALLQSLWGGHRLRCYEEQRDRQIKGLRFHVSRRLSG